MTAETRALFEAALALPEDQRALLVDELIGSLPAEADDAIQVELDRRFAEFQDDPTSAVPWSEIRRPRNA
jgi:putative addiction module component (TIGR02574 family)